MIAFTWSLGLLAQVQEQAAMTSAASVQSVWDFMVKGGLLMIPIGICSLVALAVIVERAISLRRRNIIPPDFMDGLKTAFGNNGRNRSAALEHCERSATPIARIVTAAIRRLNEPREQLEKHIEQAGQREVSKLRKYLRSLAVIVSVAPMLGLLGTVFGMIEAFQTVAASAEALGRTESLAKGIYEALVTTATGLMVAIPALIGYHWISAKIDRLVAEMDALTVEFVDTYAIGRPVAPQRAVGLKSEEPAGEPAGDADEAAVAEAAVATT